MNMHTLVTACSSVLSEIFAALYFMYCALDNILKCLDSDNIYFLFVITHYRFLKQYCEKAVLAHLPTLSVTYTDFMTLTRPVSGSD